MQLNQTDLEFSDKLLFEQLNGSGGCGDWLLILVFQLELQLGTRGEVPTR